MIETGRKKEKVILVTPTLDDLEKAEQSLDELGELVKTAGAEVAGQMIQLRDAVHPGTYIGSGKLDELKWLVWEKEVVFGLLGKLGDKAAINAAAEYLSGAVYQLYRHLYRAAGGNEAYFSLDPAACTMDTAAADMKLAQVRFARALRSLNARKVEFPDLSPEALTAAYPGRCQSLTQVLSTTDARLSELNRM